MGINTKELEKFFGTDELSEEVRQDEDDGYSEVFQALPYFIVNPFSSIFINGIGVPTF